MGYLFFGRSNYSPLERLAAGWWRWLLPVFLLASASTVVSQTTIDVNLDLKHSVGGVDSFERHKYIVLHENLFSNDWDSDQQKADLLNTYDIYLGRNNGLFPWNWNQSWEDPGRPGHVDTVRLEQTGQQLRNRYAGSAVDRSLEHRVRSSMIGGQYFASPWAGPTNPNPCCGPAQGWSYADGAAIGEFMARTTRYFFGEGGDTGEPRPTMVEVINEPFYQADEWGTTPAEVTAWHNEVAAEFRKYVPDVLIGGYTAAFPELERNDFNQWEINWKLFIDEAGENMDFYSLHLYDYGFPDNPDLVAYRTGSNIEAILDMIEQYSLLSDGRIKPWNISEYGYWSPGHLGTPYTRQRDWHYIRATNAMMMQLMERPDRMLKTVPFILTKASWWTHPSGNRYPFRLYRQQFELAGETGEEWVFTEQIKFYEQWKNVRGKRVETYSPDPDLFVDAYLDGKHAYVIISNVEAAAKPIRLNTLHWQAPSPDSVVIKHLYRAADGVPVLDEIPSTTLPGEFTLAPEGTAILEITYPHAVVQTGEATEEKLYAEEMMKPIVANQTLQFNVNDLVTGPHGEVVLRLGIGRDRPRSRRPEIEINGTPVPVPEDYRGYDQANRDRFFGVLEIPVPYALLREDNVINVRFPDGGGHVSSVALRHYIFSREVVRGNTVLPTRQPLPAGSVTVFPNPFGANFRVEIDPALGAVDLEVTDATGRRLRQLREVRGTRLLSGADLPAGVYFLRIVAFRGEGTYRLVKLH